MDPDRGRRPPHRRGFHLLSPSTQCGNETGELLRQGAGRAEHLPHEEREGRKNERQHRKAQGDLQREADKEDIDLGTARATMPRATSAKNRALITGSAIRRPS